MANEPDFSCTTWRDVSGGVHLLEEEDEEEDPEDRQLRKQSAWNWVFVGVGSIVLSFLVALI